ncbi:hypothetical protein [Bradyrhizobium ivorense]|uniref:hypothetical protein n=1 Tax=Bradyrhizobium ivorense TaxID=2511166 RepID=UPI0010AF2AD9|nr:hypothetical protein [Bradyrhizobium ivorense]VIO73903.1 hypothetical protein CI41S_40120 [Bradyrhizobium ivorense]
MADSIQIAAPDGSVVEFPAGTPDSTIKVVMAKNYPAQGGGNSELSAAASSAVHPDDAGLIHSIRDAIHAPTRIVENAFLMGLGDRARALMDTGLDAVSGRSSRGLNDLVTGKPGGYAGHLEREQAETEKFRADHPIAAPVIEGVGGIATPLGVLGAAGKGASLGAKVTYGAGAGGLLGGVLGVTNSKDWTDLPQTMRDAVFGAGTGALLGGALPVVGKGIGAGVNWLADAVRSTPGISRSAAPHLLEALQADGPAAVRARMDGLGPDAMLGDAGPALLGKMQGASLNSDEGRSILQSRLTRRNDGTNARVMADVNAALGPAEDPQTVTNAIRAHRTAVDNASYPAALQNAPDVQTAPILTQLDHAIPRAVGMERRALENLREMMMTTEQRPRLDPFGRQEVNPRTGQPVFDEVPVSQNDAEVLHKVKQELDNVIQYDAPGLGVPAGALSRQQGVLRWMRGQLNQTLENQVPGYTAANRASAALANRADAVEAGTQYLGSGKTTPSPERFDAEFGPLSQGEKIAFAKGSRGNIERVLGTKANDLEALRGELQGEGGWNTAKIASVHGQEAADALMASVDRNRKFRDTFNKVVENSQTAQRTAAARAMKPDPSSETPIVNPNMTVTGLAGTAAKKTAVAIANALLRKDPTASFGEIASILSAQGPEARAYLNALADTLNRRSLNAAASQRIGNQAALLLGSGANGALRDRLERR